MPNRRPFPGIRFLVLVFAACVLSPPAHGSKPRNVGGTSFGQDDDITVLTLTPTVNLEVAIA